MVFGVYLLGLAVILMTAPNVLLSLFGIPSTQEVWIRVVGMLAGVLGFYDVRYGRRADRSFLQMSVQVRAPVWVFFLAFVLFAGAPWQLLLFGAVELCFAGWTWWALRGSSQGAAATARG